METTGKILHLISHREGVSENTGNKYAFDEWLFETNERYPKKFPIQVSGVDRISRLNIHSDENKLVKIFFSIDSREYNGKYYPTISIFDVRPADVNEDSTASNESTAAAAAEPIAPAEPMKAPSADSFPKEAPAPTDDLPF